MSKSEQFKDRIDDLFSDEEHPQSEPVEGQQPLEVEAAPEESLPPSSLSMDAPPQSESQVKGVGWEEYLNAIDRTERLGFSFDQEAIMPLESGGKDSGSGK